MQLFPAIDLRNGQVVRLYQGDYDQQKTYGTTPLEQAKLYEAAGASWVQPVASCRQVSWLTPTPIRWPTSATRTTVERVRTLP